MSQLQNITADTREHLKALQNEMLSCAEKLELPLVHYFVNGVYGRPLSIFIVLLNLSSSVWNGRLLLCYHY